VFKRDEVPLFKKPSPSPLNEGEGDIGDEVEKLIAVSA
jgi:hypothetical protein